MTVRRHFDSYSQAREKFRDVLDAAQRGLVTSVTREGETFLVVDARQQREWLADLRPSNAEVVAEGGGWAVILPGLPLHGDGESFDDAVDDAVEALRDYAEDWNERLHLVPNHRQHRPVVELVELSTDEQLREWVVGRASSRADDAVVTA